MKMRSLAVLVLFLVCMGCATSRVSQTENYPPNTVIIVNRTPYMLDVMSNGSPWMVEKYDSQGKFLLVMPLRVYPGQPPTMLTNIILGQRLVIKINAREFRSTGCLPYEVPKGSCTREVTVPITLVIEKQDLH